MNGFDWPALMRAGLQGLRLTPAQFWALTPAELRLMLGQAGGVGALTRAGLDALLEAWPDTGPDEGKGESDDGA
ncbi:rcc01693 family protein [Lutimaribacter marinistellae]|uniref:Rcc01693 family protein n=1 Tax=Lutimaribacter marinistellae TaxID=1820329 RepID=A0ABV7TJN4_9RHOB